MAILSAREFQRAARQRFTTAEFLLQHDFRLDALYLAGYSVECILKALIMHRTSARDQQAVFNRLRSGAKMHYPEHLKEELKKVGVSMPLELVKRFRRFEWTTDLRYGSGRKPRGEVRGYLRTAAAAIQWVQEQMR